MAMGLMALAGTPATAADPLVPIIPQPGDLTALSSALAQAGSLPPGRAVGWLNPDNGRQGGVTILRRGFDAANRQCQEFHSLIVDQNRYRHEVGIACQQPDGAWQVVGSAAYPTAQRSIHPAVTP